MEIIYALDCLVITKSGLDETYTFHVSRLPALTGSAGAVLELADAIYRAEGLQLPQRVEERE